MENQNPVHVFFELIEPGTDLYTWQLEIDGKYELENVESYTWEQILESSLKTLTPAERVAARAGIANSLRRFLKKLES